MLRRFIRVLQVLLVFYVAIAVLYTTNVLIISPLRSAVSMLLTLSTGSTQSRWDSDYSETNQGTRSPRDTLQPYDLNPRFLRFSAGAMKWNTSDLALAYGLGSTDPVSLDEELFLSKAFSNSMRPSKIIPYFYRASGAFDKDDVTITTIITSNRFPVFRRLIERYQGPISATIHVRNNTRQIRDLVRSLEALSAASQKMATHVDVHLVIDSFDRQFNMWRNIARLFARTDYVMMLDVDFYICTDIRSAIKGNKLVTDKLRDGLAAIVIPAFEYVKYSEGIDPAVFPRDKQKLLGLVKSKRLAMFHASWAPGHNSTDYKRYYAAPTGDMYKVTQYQSAYEPYVVIKREGPPWCVFISSIGCGETFCRCDERFVGYGGNKAACHFEMYISGISYFVLSDHFIIHQNHRYEEVARKNERKHNRRVYLDFKEETCLRYLQKYQDHKLLNTMAATNAQQECKNIKRVARIAAEMLKST